MRQQEVEPGRRLRYECVINGIWIISNVYRAQDSGVKMAKFRLSQQRQRTVDLEIATVTVPETPVPVVRHHVAVQRYAYLDAILGKQSAPLLIQPDTVGNDPSVNCGDGRQVSVQALEDGSRSRYAEQQWLSAV
jgi:hypothetical protein